jgi:hypothetical protein
MPKAIKGAVIGFVRCPSCGNPEVPISFDRNLVPYAVCHRLDPTEDYQRCGWKEWWGRQKARLDRKKYESDQHDDTTQKPGPQAANENKRPSRSILDDL